jgi:hypothetical protein
MLTWLHQAVLRFGDCTTLVTSQWLTDAYTPCFRVRSRHGSQGVKHSSLFHMYKDMSLRVFVRAPSGLGNSVLCVMSWREKSYARTGFIVVDIGPERTRLLPGLWSFLSPSTKWHSLNGLLYSWICIPLRLFPDNMGCPTCSSTCPSSLRHSFRFSDVHTSIRCLYVGQWKVPDYLNVCWCRHKNREIVSICYHRILVVRCTIPLLVRCRSSIYTSISADSKPKRKVACSLDSLVSRNIVAFNLYRREVLIIHHLNDCDEFHAGAVIF